MKKFLFLGVIGALVTTPQYSHALSSIAYCLGAVCESGVPDGNSIPANCASHGNACYGGKRIYSCTTCDSGYTLTSTTTTVDGCSNAIQYYYCQKDNSSGGDDCDGTCDNCESSDWETLAAGYQRQMTKTCNTSTCACSSTTSYRCAAGYYGTATAFSCQTSLVDGITCNSTDCQLCPAADGIYTNANRTTQAYGTVAAGNGNAKTACYLPNGTYYDTTGEFQISATYTFQKCGYSE